MLSSGVGCAIFGIGGQVARIAMKTSDPPTPKTAKTSMLKALLWRVQRLPNFSRVKNRSAAARDLVSEATMTSINAAPIRIASQGFAAWPVWGLEPARRAVRLRAWRMARIRSNQVMIPRPEAQIPKIRKSGR